MAQKHRFHNQRLHRRAPQGMALRQAPTPVERTAPVQYSKPFVMMEDENKNTFIYQDGAWVPCDKSIAECRRDCQVKELPQRLNRMVRYEVRCPVSDE